MDFSLSTFFSTASSSFSTSSTFLVGFSSAATLESDMGNKVGTVDDVTERRPSLLEDVAGLEAGEPIRLRLSERSFAVEAKVEVKAVGDIGRLDVRWLAVRLMAAARDSGGGKKGENFIGCMAGKVFVAA